jgi:hypothetical protein
MSHADIADVWAVLARRGDVGHIMLELIGTHYMNICTARRERRLLRTAYVSHIGSMKTILDLQRTYLQAAQVSNRLCLLPLETLVPTITHLMDVVISSMVACSDLSNEEAYNSLTAQTVLSGLRLLLLRGQTLSTKEHDQLSSRFEEIHERGHWQSGSLTIFLRVCRQTFLHAADPGREPSFNHPACSETSLPDALASAVRMPH